MSPKPSNTLVFDPVRAERKRTAKQLRKARQFKLGKKIRACQTRPRDIRKTYCKHKGAWYWVRMVPIEARHEAPPDAEHHGPFRTKVLALADAKGARKENRW